MDTNSLFFTSVAQTWVSTVLAGHYLRMKHVVMCCAVVLQITKIPYFIGLVSIACMDRRLLIWKAMMDIFTCLQYKVQCMETPVFLRIYRDLNTGVANCDLTHGRFSVKSASVHGVWMSSSQLKSWCVNPFSRPYFHGMTTTDDWSRYSMPNNNVQSSNVSAVFLSTFRLRRMLRVPWLWSDL